MYKLSAIRELYPAAEKEAPSDLDFTGWSTKV